MVIISQFPALRSSDGLTGAVLLLLSMKCLFSLNFVNKNLLRIIDFYHGRARRNLILRPLKLWK